MGTSRQKKLKLTLTPQDLEQFLYLEAALLDDWKLEAWLELFEPGATYYVPPAGAPDGADPANTLFYVADDWHRLTERIKRLLKRTAHVEYPHSKCRRMVSNIRILAGTDDEFTATSNFVTYRSKRGKIETYYGHHLYTLTFASGTLKIRQKTSHLDSDDIAEQGKVSIII